MNIKQEMDIDTNKTNNCREYKYDNLKAILIFLVVFGHTIEYTQNLNWIFLIIYSFHMPVFVFISGYFFKGNKKSILKPISVYIVFQLIYFLVYKLILKDNITFNLQPIWLLWYIFALFVWNVIAYMIKLINNKTKIFGYAFLIISIVLSLICGYFDSIGRAWSVSRIITFLPFFLLGYFYRNNNIEILNKNSKILKCYIILAIICIIYFLSIPNINRIWFFGAYSYKNGGYNIIFKTMTCLFSIIMIYMCTNFAPTKKTIISYIGKNTLNIYLYHGLIIKIFNSQINKMLNKNNVIYELFLAIAITIIIIAGIEVIEFCVSKIHDIVKKKCIKTKIG